MHIPNEIILVITYEPHATSQFSWYIVMSSQWSKLNGPLIESTPTLLACRNMVPDPIFMPIVAIDPMQCLCEILKPISY